MIIIELGGATHVNLLPLRQTGFGPDIFGVVLDGCDRMNKLIQQLGELGITREQHNQAVKAWLQACTDQGTLIPFYPFLDEIKNGGTK